LAIDDRDEVKGVTYGGFSIEVTDTTYSFPGPLKKYSALSTENSLQGKEKEHGQAGPDGKGDEP
jgi:hypothetical protein